MNQGSLLCKNDMHGTLMMPSPLAHDLISLNHTNIVKSGLRVD